MAYASIAVEGGMFPADLLDRIAGGQGDGQRPADFGLPAGRRITDETQGAFSEIRSYWEAFQYRLKRSTGSSTTLTRENWVLPLLQALGFQNVEFQRAAVTVGSESYAISHRAGTAPDATVVHIVGLGQRLDVRDGRRSPHALVQEYLNRSDSVWAILTNGRQLRLLRDTARLAKPTYLEFNLEAMVDANLYSEFVLLYRLIHASRFPVPGVAGHDCLLERYYQLGIEEGGRVRDKLRDGVAEALNVLGSAFLSHPESSALRARFESGALNAPAYYRQLLRLVYRLLFLMAAEERKLIFPSETPVTNQTVYDKYYSVSRLRDRCERRFSEDRYSDLWLGLRQTFALFREDSLAGKLGLHALNGELFGPDACADLEQAGCENRDLLAAMYRLSTYLDDKVRRRVNYAFLDVEEFGSVYESLLDFHPRVTLAPPTFDLVAGSDRKQTGSYYTPPELVHELIESALVPVVEERLAAARTKEAKVEALLALRVCDPAAGSGHFLLAAGRRIARELAKVRSEEAEPPPEEYRHALRDVIRHCLYAVDKNPLAVDLCKVALWIEGHNAGLPLSFLDNHVKCGDSLVGVFDLKVLEEGIPDDAYKPVTGDDKTAASYYRKRNQEEKKAQRQLAMGAVADVEVETHKLAEDFGVLAELEERTPRDVKAKEDIYTQLRGTHTDWWRLRTACDLWTAAFFLPLLKEDALHFDQVPTTETVRAQLRNQAAHGALVGRAVELGLKHPFFHWPLEFPEVFEQGGFDVVLGNPPWERIKLQEEEFFAVRAPDIANARNRAARQTMIEALGPRADPLAIEFAAAKHEAEAESKFARGSGRFPLGAVGDVNTYVLFAEQFRRLLALKGRAGIIIPDTFATNSTTSAFFADLVESGSLHSLYGFKNERFLFKGIEHTVTYALVTIGGTNVHFDQTEFCWLAWTLEEMHRPERRVILSADDFALFNPNTRTCPVFRSRRDAEVTTAIYRSVPVLMNERTGENPWGVSFHRMFDMSNDSALFRDRAEPGVAPLYEAKLVHQYDHRWASYDGDDTRDVTQGEKLNPTFAVTPRYWVAEAEVDARLNDQGWNREWLLAWRDTARNTDIRTVIGSVVPRLAMSNKMPVVLIDQSLTALDASCLQANLAAFPLDFAARQKVGGATLNFFYVKQFPVLPPSTYDELCFWDSSSRLCDWIASRVLELTYTAEDLVGFAKELGYYGSPFRWDVERRFLLRCELDAAFFHLYGVERDDVDYIMDTFPIVRRDDEKAHGEYRTKRVILEIYDEMTEAMKTGRPYQTRLDPPPADPRVAHGAVMASP